MVEQSCCTCKHHFTGHELAQDRLDVDVVHYCEVKGDRLYADHQKLGDCDDFELKPELLEGNG